MIWIVLKIIVAVFLAGAVSLVLLSGLAVGFFCLHIGRRCGPRMLLESTVLGSALLLIFWVWAGERLDLEVAGYASAIVTAGCALAVVIPGWQDIRSEVAYEKVLTAWLPRFGLRVFDSLDADKDDIVTAADLAKAMAAAGETEDRFYLYLLRSHIVEVGHRLDSKTVRRLAKQEGRRWYQDRSDLFCGMSKQDLATYAERVRRKNCHWL